MYSELNLFTIKNMDKMIKDMEFNGCVLFSVYLGFHMTSRGGGEGGGVKGLFQGQRTLPLSTSIRYTDYNRNPRYFIRASVRPNYMV